MAGLVALALSTTLAATPAAAQVEYRDTTPNLTPTPQAGTARAASDLRVNLTRTNVLLGNRATVSGTLRPAGAGRIVRLQRRSGNGWLTIADTRTDAAGRFVVRLTPRSTGSTTIRLRFSGDEQARPARETLDRLNVFRKAFASWYGPGLYGNPMGCGGRLNPGTLGVAHKTLPCGTSVTLRHNGNIVRVRVVDRGPYVGGREFDLTEATKRALGFGSTGYVQTTR